MISNGSWIVINDGAGCLEILIESSIKRRTKRNMHDLRVLHGSEIKAFLKLPSTHGGEPGMMQL